MNSPRTPLSSRSAFMRHRKPFCPHPIGLLQMKAKGQDQNESNAEKYNAKNRKRFYPHSIGLLQKKAKGQDQNKSNAEKYNVKNRKRSYQDPIGLLQKKAKGQDQNESSAEESKDTTISSVQAESSQLISDDSGFDLSQNEVLRQMFMDLF